MPTLRNSLRLRLLLGTLLWIALSVVVTGFALGSLFRHHVEEQFHAELNTHLDQLTAHLTHDRQGKPTLSVAQSDPRFSKPYSGLYWQIDPVTPATKATPGLLRSRSLWDEVLRLPADTPDNGEVHRHRLAGPNSTQLGAIERVIHLEEIPANAERKFRLIIAADERKMEEPVERFNGMLLLSLGLLGAGFALVAFFQVVIALAPLRRLRGALASVRNSQTSRLEGSFPSEIQPLVEEFNTVLAQNSSVVERARTQAGNLAHALKTPLSVMANAVHDKDDEQAQLIAHQVAVARQQIDYHLSRARVAASVGLPGARTPLAPVLAGLVRVMQRIHADRNLDFIQQAPERPLAFRGEQQDLHEMLGNLLDNACKWASRRIDISATQIDAELRIRIDDDGCGIGETECQRVLLRGERADEQVPGSGLGLSIVDELARLYGGRIELSRSVRGGLSVLLVLPAVVET